jgi:hypothetical protein
VRVLRYRQHKSDGSVIQAEWLTNFPVAKPGSLSLYRCRQKPAGKSKPRFNDGKNRYGMEHICHHKLNSALIVWLLILLALVHRAVIPDPLSAPWRTWHSLRRRSLRFPLADQTFPQSTR